MESRLTKATCMSSLIGHGLRVGCWVDTKKEKDEGERKEIQKRKKKKKEGTIGIHMAQPVYDTRQLGGRLTGYDL